MTSTDFAREALRVAVLLGLALGAMPLLRGAAASTRRRVLVLALGGALVLPAVSALVPRWQMHTPDAVIALRDRVVKEPLGDAPTPGTTVAAPAATPIVAPPTTHSRVLTADDALLALWAVGALLVLARLVVGTWQVRGWVRRSQEAPSWATAAQRAATSTSLDVHVRSTDEIDAPAVAGVISPVVLVPRSSETWSDDRRYAVLLHELAHVRERDCLAHVLGQVVCALHWFNPLAWLVARRLRLERELAADDAVVLGGARPSSYADDLLAIAGVVLRPVPPGALGVAEPTELTTRVLAIVATQRARRPLGLVGRGLLTAAVGAALLAVACTSPTTKSTPAANGSGSPSAAPPPAPVAPAAETTIDPRLQAVVGEELDRVMRDSSGLAGTVLVLDPKTGAILAEAGRIAGEPVDVAATSAYITGSTLKAVTLAAALEEGVVQASERIDCEQGKYAYGGKTMEDYKAFGPLTVPEMLAVSTNIGFTKIFDRLGGARLERWLRKFHFAEAPELRGAAAGVLKGPIEDKSFAGAVTAIGERMTASPLQIAAAYAAIANDGVYVSPTRTPRAANIAGERLLKPETARTLVRMLEGAVQGPKATGTAARVEGITVAGKTGTAEWERTDGKTGSYASFVGFVPSTSPRFVILVGVESPKDKGTGGQVAAPVFARVATKALATK